MIVPPGYETWREVRQRAAETWPDASGPKLLGYLVTGELQAWESDDGCNVKAVSADDWRKEEWRRLCLARPNDLSSKDKQPVLKTEDLRKLMPTSSEMLDDAMKRHRAKKEAALAAVANRKEEAAVASPASEPAMSSSKRGRPTKLDWDSMWIEIIRIVYEERVYLERVALTQRLLQWFHDSNFQPPGTTIMKQKMAKLFKVIEDNSR
jgi:hypothetical protein